ncbi:MAG: HD domain-containing protein [Clostridiales bacterium]|nr:HD domain-containing protein [Clostridiales bacterium]
MLTFETIKKDAAIRTYITQADAALGALGYTEHSFAHVTRCAEVAGDLLENLGYPSRTAELARMAGYLHDIGNLVNRADHSQSGAVMAFQLLHGLGMAPEEIAPIVTAIGNHDEGTGVPVSPMAAALILADKSDVRRSRVRCKAEEFDIHDRVNYSVTGSGLVLSEDHKTLTLQLTIDTGCGSVMEYFEIFLERMLLCRKAADFLGLQFKLTINDIPQL